MSPCLDHRAGQLRPQASSLQPHTCSLGMCLKRSRSEGLGMKRCHRGVRGMHMVTLESTQGALGREADPGHRPHQCPRCRGPGTYLQGPWNPPSPATSPSSTNSLGEEQPLQKGLRGHSGLGPLHPACR